MKHAYNSGLQYLANSTNLTDAVIIKLCLLLNDTSALFRPLVPRIVKVEHETC